MGYLLHTMRLAFDAAVGGLAWALLGAAVSLTIGAVTIALGALGSLTVKK